MHTRTHVLTHIPPSFCHPSSSLHHLSCEVSSAMTDRQTQAFMNMNGAVNMNMQMRRAGSLPAVFFLKMDPSKSESCHLSPSLLQRQTGLIADLTGRGRVLTVCVSVEAKSLIETLQYLCKKQMKYVQILNSSQLPD